MSHSVEEGDDSVMHYEEEARVEEAPAVVVIAPAPAEVAVVDEVVPQFPASEEVLPAIAQVENAMDTVDSFLAKAELGPALEQRIFVSGNLDQALLERTVAVKVMNRRTCQSLQNRAAHERERARRAIGSLAKIFLESIEAAAEMAKQGGDGGADGGVNGGRNGDDGGDGGGVGGADG